MEEQKETTEQIHKKRRIQSPSSSASTSTSTSSLPVDLISEILSKLPLKSLVRFRCVSKLWSSITTDPYFTNTFKTRSRPSLLVCFRRDDRLFVLSVPQDRQNSKISSQPVDSYHMTYPKHRPFATTKSVHGLLCFPRGGKTIIWNPTLRKFLTLNKPEKSWTRAKVFLGYDPIERKHKVLCMPSDDDFIDECRVLTLGSSAQDSWRKYQTNHKHHPIPHSHECINGVLYYRAFTCTRQTDYVPIVMSFDVRSEKFHMIKLPWNEFGSWDHIDGGQLTIYEGRLACVRCNDAGHGATVWILRDAEKHDWSLEHFPAPVPYDYEREREGFNLIGLTDGGEFVYAPRKFHESFYVLYYDPKRERFHRVEFKGIEDHKFWRKHGLSRSRLYNIYAVPNHIESLMSL